MNNKFAAQYAYIARNKDKYRAYAKAYYERVKADPEKLAAKKAKRKVWYEANKEDVLQKQRERKRARKLWAIEYLGGECSVCHEQFLSAAYEFHHRDPKLKDRDPSKMMQLSLARLKAELDLCDLVCANCHRVIHHHHNDNENPCPG